MQRFENAPFLVIWEVTQACRLACLHCRAAAQPNRHPLELTTLEGKRLLREIRSFGQPLLVLTGGDPLARLDLFDILSTSFELGLRTTVTPSATELLTAAAIRRFQQIGVSRMALSLDGPDDASHDHFRGVPGSFRRTVEALDKAREIGLPTQVNTTITRFNRNRLKEMAKRVERTRARLWSVFFLVTMGRARREDDLTADEYEEVFSQLYELSGNVSFDIKTTEAQHYRRYVAQKRAQLPARLRPLRKAAPLRASGINDGKGLVFVSHTGEIYPSGFLPISAGNVRRDSLVTVYRESDLFRRLRDTSLLKGKCGICKFRNLCGGSRARSYALTGDYLESDPRCSFQP